MTERVKWAMSRRDGCQAEPRGGIPELSRVCVIGSSCAGKTTFARRLAERLEVVHIELDAIFWLPGWQERPRDEFRSLIGAAVAGERWVADGNYSRVQDLIWARATTII